jgi:hypothetical protein
VNVCISTDTFFVFKLQQKYPDNHTHATPPTPNMMVRYQITIQESLYIHSLIQLGVAWDHGEPLGIVSFSKCDIICESENDPFYPVTTPCLLWYPIGMIPPSKPKSKTRHQLICNHHNPFGTPIRRPWKYNHVYHLPIHYLQSLHISEPSSKSPFLWVGFQPSPVMVCLWHWVHTALASFWRLL